ncbi:hypothetical protein CASFOL_019675 [Castilleja foliolosa]|uniref:DUF4372 domain-containing protein n=1 Tax=Castilleja foliolosa TaxID=1961234 RepID=A0ABD3CYP6_9LAMI
MVLSSLKTLMTEFTSCRRTKAKKNLETKLFVSFFAQI